MKIELKSNTNDWVKSMNITEKIDAEYAYRNKIFNEIKSQESKELISWVDLIFSNIGSLYRVAKRGFQIGINLIVVIGLLYIYEIQSLDISLNELKEFTYKVSMVSFTLGFSWSFVSSLALGTLFKNTINESSSKRTDRFMSSKSQIDTTRRLIDRRLVAEGLITSNQSSKAT